MGKRINDLRGLRCRSRPGFRTQRDDPMLWRRADCHLRNLGNGLPRLEILKHKLLGRNLDVDDRLEGGEHEWGDLWGLTFELSGRRRQDARPGPVKMYSVPPARAWWPAVGAPLERGVRLHAAAATMSVISGVSLAPKSSIHAAFGLPLDFGSSVSVQSRVITACCQSSFLRKSKARWTCAGAPL